MYEMKSIAKLKQKKLLNEQQPCAYCGKQTAHSTLLNHNFDHGDNLIVVENVATMVCSNCGQSYFTGQTLEKLDEILAAPENYSSRQMVQVADFSKV